MKARLKTILVTFVATTLFWCLLIVGVFWFAPEQSGVSVVDDAIERGYVVMMSARNTESQPVTFIVEELRANVPGADSQRAFLLERQLPPAGAFWIGIKKGKTEARP